MAVYFFIPACPESFFVFRRIPGLPKKFGTAGMTKYRSLLINSLLAGQLYPIPYEIA